MGLAGLRRARRRDEGPGLHQGLRPVRPAVRHHARRRPRDRPESTRHGALRGRQPHLHARGDGPDLVGRRELREHPAHRHRHPSPPEDHAREHRGHAGSGHPGERRHPADHRAARHRLGHRLRGGVRGAGGARAVAGGPLLRLQPRGGDGLADGHGQPRRHDLGVPRGPRVRPLGALLGPGGRVLAHPAHRRRRRLRSRGDRRHDGGGAAGHLGHQPRARDRHRRADSRS